MSFTRQLTAIVFADIVGYTAMMQDDEARAFQLRNKLQDKLEKEVVLHHGRIVEFKGDGALCSFASAIEAVKASVGLQLAMQTVPIVPLRIGIHTGDVMIQGNSIYGDGVNIASRIESLAQAGSILISSKVYDDTKNQNDIQTVALGKYALKNVKEQVEIFAISNPGIRVPLASSLHGKGEKVNQKSIMVLPFVNISSDAEQEYFNDGLTEELISNLSRLKEMKVVSRTTSMKYKGTKQDIRAIGAETESAYIMEGSVRKQGSNLRITAQFVDANNDKHLWSETYKGTIDDIFDIQERVAGKIVDALRLQLDQNEKDFFQKRYTENTEAYQLYLQGRFFWNKRNEKALRSAILFFERAIQKDPLYALAWAGLGDSYFLLTEYSNISRTELLPKILKSVNKALEIDNSLAEAHTTLGILHMICEWDWIKSENEFKLAIELSPRYATAHHWYSELLLVMGRVAAAFHEISLAVELDPVSQGILKDKGIFYYYTRQYDEAIDMGIKTLELAPKFAAAHRLLSLAYLGKGKIDEAVNANQQWGIATGNKVKTRVALAYIYAVAGRKKEAMQIVQEEIRNDQLTDNDYRGIALVFTALGDKDLAFEWLEKSLDRHEESLCNLKVDPKMDSLHTDPRFREILERIGLEKTEYP